MSKVHQYFILSIYFLPLFIPCGRVQTKNKSSHGLILKFRLSFIVSLRRHLLWIKRVKITEHKRVCHSHFSRKKKKMWFSFTVSKNNTCSHNYQEPQSSNPNKTPIQILHEYGIKCGSLPVYVMEKAEGEAHQPSFVFSVKFGEVTCTGNPESRPCFADTGRELSVVLFSASPCVSSCVGVVYCAPQYHL